jgi:plasmid maintenance system antidote protein VapI
MNSILRDKTEKYLEKYGTPKKFLAAKIGVTGTTISLFLKGERELSDAKEKLLRAIIEEDNTL